jgi:hypothetical protein
MTRPHLRLSRLTVVLLLALSACGSEEPRFRAKLEDGSEDSFPGFNTRLSGTDPLMLLTCSKDPTPQVADDERALCLNLHLDAAGLSAAGAPATLSIAGEARLTEPRGPTPPTFTVAAGHSPVVSVAWAIVGCYAPVRPGPLVQQLRGRLELEENSATRLSGRVVLTSEGELAVADCGKVSSADFDFRFDVAR